MVKGDTMRALKLFVATATALSIAASPALAQAGAAAKLSVKNVAAARASTDAGDSNKLAPAILIGVLATVALIGGAIVLADSDDTPDSP
jgi:hypothetical protein